jgi:hypothetical protein
MWYTILVLLALDVGGLLLVYVLLRDRVRRATTANAQITEIRDEMSRLVVELNQTTDRNIALIEDRIASLNELLSAADKKIGLLHREIEKHDVGTQVYSRLAEGRPMRGGPPVQGQVSERAMRPQEPAPRQAPRQQPQAGQAAASPGAAAGMPQRGQEPQGAAAAPAQPLAVELSEQPPAANADTPDLRERVLMLHRAGFAASLIASRVGVPLGEVELIISLEQRKGRA